MTCNHSPQNPPVRTTHELKTMRLFFGDVRAGRKPFEIRLNDRDFHVGDTLKLLEIDDEGTYTGYVEWREVSYLLTAFRQGDVDVIAPGYVVMGLGPSVVCDGETGPDGKPCYGC